MQLNKHHRAPSRPPLVGTVRTACCGARRPVLCSQQQVARASEASQSKARMRQFRLINATSFAECVLQQQGMLAALAPQPALVAMQWQQLPDHFMLQTMALLVVWVSLFLSFLSCPS